MKNNSTCGFCNVSCGNSWCVTGSENMIKVEYIQHWGSDLMVVNSARVSFGNEKESVDEKDVKLINYLAKHKHMTPFEHMGLTVKITCPLYIRSQIMRHRTFAYNEISRRYTGKDLEFYVPKITDFRMQSKDNKQCSEGAIEGLDALKCKSIIEELHEASLNAYNKLIELGLSREQSRGVLAQNLQTEFYMSGSLRNWQHFLNLRESDDAQAEVRYVAAGVRALIDEHFENSAKALKG